jgi:N-methylhydantoinase A/oxoprolinase/acetone carboxylase beta subunit
MAELRRGGVAWELIVRARTPVVHSAYGDLTDDKRERFATFVSEKMADVERFWSDLALAEVENERRHVEPGRPVQDRASE